MLADAVILDGLVMDVVPEHGVVEAGRAGLADGEDQSAFERHFQKSGAEWKETFEIKHEN